MIFAILFVVAFLIGLLVYQFSGKWLSAVLITMGVFVVTTLADTSASESWTITFIFGLPIVFVGSLFGAYVVQLRRGEEDLIDGDDDTETSLSSKQDRDSEADEQT